MMTNDEFVTLVESVDPFGLFVSIETGMSRKRHVYKVVGSIKSNYYCSVPIMGRGEPYLHRQTETVLNVIHCGIDESHVIRVRAKDAELFDTNIEAIKKFIEDKDG